MILLITSLAYLLGSIPFGLLLAKWFGLGDIRAIGSGNIGATNVLRTGNKGVAAATLFLDGFKGTLAVLVARHFGYPAYLCAGFAVFLGHLFPVWLGFKGGKGVATGLGVFLGEFFLLGLAACATWLLVAFTTKYSSLAALTTFLLVPALALALGHHDLAVLALFIAALVFWKHRANIARLRAGTEPKIGRNS
jgi:glycerol-3-phosphate acyltransferase PlsY